MRHTIGIMLMAMIVSISLTSCEKINGEGPAVSELRSHAGFTRIAVSLPGAINYRIDPTYRVELIAQRNVLDILETTISGNELIIKVKNGKRLKGHENIIVNVNAPVATFVDISGSGDVHVSGPLSGADFGMRISGSGTVLVDQLTLTNKLSANVNGSGDIKVNAGTCANEDIKISGSGNVDLANVASSRADVDISGSGEMWIRVSQQLNAKITGSGSVNYRGTPTINSNISGSGKLVAF